MERGRSRRRRKAGRGIFCILAILLIGAVILLTVLFFKKGASVSENLQTEETAASEESTQAAEETGVEESTEASLAEKTSSGNGVVISDLVDEEEWTYTASGKKASYYKLRLPRIEIEANQSAADKINQYYQKILEEQKKSKEDFMEIVKMDDVQEMLESQDYEEYLEEVEEYNLLFNQGSVLSISLSYSSYSAGVHGYAAEFLKSFDTSTGEELTLKTLAKEEGTFRSFLVGEITKVLEKEGLLEALFEGSLTEESIVNYCLVPDGIRILYNPYDIAPYAAGSQEAVIPYEDCMPYLSDYGKELVSFFGGQGE